MPAVSVVTRWAFYLYVAWIPLEYPDRTLRFDLGTLMGAVFLATTVLSFRACYRRLSAPLVLYLVFLYFWVASWVANGAGYQVLVRDSFLRLLLLILVLWTSTNLLKDPRVFRNALLIVLGTCSMLALLQVSGVADMYGSGEGVSRATVLGQNPNRTGRFLAGAALAAVGLALATPRPRLTTRAVYGVSVALLCAAMLQGGSRGAMLALLVSLLPFALIAPSFGARVRNAVVAMLVMAGLAWGALQSPLMQRRIALAESGNLAKREVIFPAATGMILERPWLGWGPVSAYYELGSRISRGDRDRRDTHNIVLELFTTTGALGGVPALLAIGLCFIAAWRSRYGIWGALPLAFMVQMLVANMSGNNLTFKLYFLFQAFAIASM
ncbi:MAG TPA: O-antigen ligase family protein, partial [Gemmatimonadales bacterium]|nr:O-antigen ligase family protein [Gemmatimonadales bacterium]